MRRTPALPPHPIIARRGSGGRRGRATALGAVVAVAGVIAAGSFAFAPASALPVPAGSATKPATGPSAPVTYGDGTYIVTLVDEPAATYTGDKGFEKTAPDGARQLDASAPAVELYSAHLQSTQSAVASAVGASVDYSYTLTLNGFSANLTGDQASALAARKDVAAVTKSEVQHLDRAAQAAVAAAAAAPAAPVDAAALTPFPETGQVSSTDFLGLTGDDGVWAQLGGQQAAGAGIVVGDIDSGIAPENPSFAGDELGSAAGADPYLADGRIVFEKSDGQTYSGICQEGADADQQWTGEECNTKLIGASWFLPTALYDLVGTPDRPEYLSPRDGDGHGSHTTSTAAGNADVDATIGDYDFGDISGVAPAAKVAEYKVCWNGNGVETDDGCYTESILAAIEQAVADGVDVINYSIGGGSATSTFALEDQAFFGAAAAGVFVSASAGNSGPDASTLDHASPWYTTVAASSIPTYTATAELGDGQKFAGSSITVHEPVEAPIVLSADVAGDGVEADAATICDADSLDPALTAGKVVVCEAGVTARVSKSAEVARAGGAGMLLVNPFPNADHADDHSVPSIQIDSDAYDAIYAYAATPGATVTLVQGNTSGVERPTPQVAGFSSRGPAEADGADVLKPDISAPGVSILADGANAQGDDATFQFESGTSMSAPHIAGLAALYLTRFPTASVSTIKSSMMTSAYDTVNQDGSESRDVFAQGAGHVDPTRMLDPGLVYDSGVPDWIAFLEGEGYVFTEPTGIDPIDPSDLNQASIAIGSLAGVQTVTRTVTSTAAGTYTADVSVDGVDTTVTPSTLSFSGPGETASYTVSFAVTDAPLDEFASGYLTWTNEAGGEVRSPIAVRPVAIAAPYEVSGEGNTGSVTVPITPGIDGELPLSVTGLVEGDLAEDASAADGHSGTLPAGKQFTSTMTIEEGTSFARFDLDAIDDTADLDLYVDLLDDAGKPAKSYVSATGSADERVDIENPEPGTYQVRADVYAAPSGQSEATFDLVEYALGTGDATGDLTATPATLAVVSGQPIEYAASWTGLDGPARFLGAVAYGDTGAYTLVSVVTTQAAPEPTPTPTPTVTPAPTDPGTPPAPVPGDGGSAAAGLAATGSAALGIGIIAVIVLAAGLVTVLIIRRRAARN
ncbi:S8 family serine peptidase [Herbiconiux sp. YIM B11900]|uniref:S8 family serine peptidase n=1 Tax=Herbiconiux sp. YIM B11900 TaxID=3404131 RepID=UPI003F86483C